ncbi:MAG TPA: phosphoribosyltransferase family protein [Longimicrobiales bacterium]|nr:phosphoribosyltransferase family protein [Longimicrobiales bacterium]
MSLPFRDRHDAGRQLAGLLAPYMDDRAVVLGLPRGGIPVAYEIAHVLHAALDVFLVRHLPAPGTPATRFGVVGSGGVRVLKQDVIASLCIAELAVEEITQRESVSLIARERTYRGHHAVEDPGGRLVILVDDGTTPADVLIEAVDALREHEPRTVVLALPFVAADVRPALLCRVDDLVVVATIPPPVDAGDWYHEFLPISHTEVRALLSLCHAEAQSRALAGSLEA